MAPCKLSISSGEVESQRSTMARARVSVAQASRFSSSVRVMTRRVSSSSISVASQKSPGLSAAMAG